MLFVGTSIIHPSTEGVFLLCNILDLLIYSNNQFLTIGDFVKICDVIKVGVFEVMIENHPKNREVKYNVYKNMSEYISTVPECFPKEETDPSIAEGKFDVSFAEYKYHFEVVGQSVVVHCMKTFEE